MPISKLLRKHYLFVPLNFISIALLILWLFKSCSSINTSITSIFIDFLCLLTCFYSIVRVSQSMDGKFNPIDMITVYYSSLFFLFVWFIKMLTLAWDHFYTKNPDDTNLVISVVVFITLVTNFYITEKVNLQNLDKIESL